MPSEWPFLGTVKLSHFRECSLTALVQEDDAWVCSCHLLHRDQRLFLASYRRTGPRPLSRTGFYSFVEDWDRSSGAAGEKSQIICDRLIQLTDNKYL